jgi:nucleotide-binding universal stress UspA family protein
MGKMKKVLIAVDEAKGSRSVLSAYYNMVQTPGEVVLLHVERLEGRSLMIDMLGEAEMSTLREMVRETEHKEALDQRAGKLLDFYRRELGGAGGPGVRTVLREGRPAEEILKVAEEEGVDLILLGYNGKKGLNRLISGSVGREVKKRAKVPVLVAKRTIMCEEPYTWKDAYTAVSVFTALMLGFFLLGLIIQRGALLH